MNVTLTEITVDKGNVAKEYRVDKAGELSVKSAANIYAGTAEVKSIPFEDFSNYLNSLGKQNDKCITLGVFGEVGEQKHLTTREALKEDYIARTKEFFNWCNGGKIGLIYLDFDKPVSGTEREDFLKDLDVLLQDPLIGKSETERTTICKWIRGSSSSSVSVHGETGSGLHVFMPIKGDATGIVQLIHRLCWLDERFRGWRLTEAGTVLPESLVDGLVGSAERVIYTSDAKIIADGDFDWIKPIDRECKFVPGGVLDAELTRNTLEVICTDFRYEWNIYRKGIEKSPEVVAKRKEWKRKQVEKYTLHGKSVRKAKQIVKGFENRTLYSDFTLLRTDGTEILVRDILLNPDDWIDVGGFADPIKREPGRNVGMVLGEPDDLILHSFSHGGIRYKLRWEFKDLMEWATTCELRDLEENFAEYGAMCGESGITGAQEDQLAQVIAKRLGLNKTSLRRDIKEETKKHKTRDNAKNDADEEFTSMYDLKEDGSHLPTESTHGDIITDFISSLGDCRGYGDAVYTWSGSSIWHGLNIGTIQKRVRIKYNHVDRCKRVSDYRAIASAVISEEDINISHWEESTGFPCSNGFYEVSREGFSNIDTDSGYKFIRLREYRKEDYCRFKMGLKPDFDWKMEGSLFSRLVYNVDNPVLLQQLCGLAICGMLPILQKVATFYGDGGAGKGTFFDILEAMLPKNRLTSISLDQMNEQKYRMELADSRINFISEIRKDKGVNLTGLKEIVGGATITGRPLYMPPVTFKPNVGMIVSMNEFFRLNETGSAIQRRFGDTIVKFVRRNEEQIEGLSQMIIENELPGVLAWCMEGVELWGDVGLDVGLSKELWAEWESIENPISLFIGERIDKGGRGILRAEMWNTYKDFCENSNTRPLRKGEFYQKISKVLGPPIRKNTGWIWPEYHIVV